MPYATWNGTVLAESDDVVVVDGKTYFPRDAVQMELLQPSEERSVCFWKGTAEYFDVVVDGEVNRGAAWHYPTPSPEASMVSDRIAFWRGVQVESGHPADEHLTR